MFSSIVKCQMLAVGTSIYEKEVEELILWFMFCDSLEEKH